MNAATVPPRLRAVIADDHERARTLISGLLAPTHQVVGAVEDGVQALEAARRLSPDLLLIDLDMPRLTGLEAVPPLRLACPRALIVIMTVSEDRSLAERALALGANAFVVKSRMAKDLAVAIAEAAAGRPFVSPLGE